MTKSIPRATIARKFVEARGRSRYSGALCYYPGWMFLQNRRDPVGYPYHPNWKTGECHPDFWDYFASGDHVLPRARGGTDDDDNIVIATARENMLEKGNRTNEEMGWTIQPIAEDDGWDGGLTEFLAAMDADPSLHTDDVLRDWYLAGKQALEDAKHRAPGGGVHMTRPMLEAHMTDHDSIREHAAVRGFARTKVTDDSETWQTPGRVHFTLTHYHDRDHWMICGTGWGTLWESFTTPDGMDEWMKTGPRRV